MDKFEYKVKSEEMLSCVASEDYRRAESIADSIDWRRVKSVSMLCTVSDIYDQCGRYDDAREILFIAYDKAPSNRNIIFGLTELAIKTGELDEARDCYDEYVAAAPHDGYKYVLQYELLSSENAPIEDQIAALEEFKSQEYTEKWAYELAKLYETAGMTSKCISECDDIFLWFSEGKYVRKALELKRKYRPLTANQTDALNNLMETEEDYEDAMRQRKAELLLKAHRKEADERLPKDENSNRTIRPLGEEPEKSERYGAEASDGMERYENNDLVSVDRYEVRNENDGVVYEGLEEAIAEKEAGYMEDSGEERPGSLSDTRDFGQEAARAQAEEEQERLAFQAEMEKQADVEIDDFSENLAQFVSEFIDDVHNDADESFENVDDNEAKTEPEFMSYQRDDVTADESYEETYQVVDNGQEEQTTGMNIEYFDDLASALKAQIPSEPETAPVDPDNFLMPEEGYDEAWQNAENSEDNNESEETVESVDDKTMKLTPVKAVDMERVSEEAYTTKKIVDPAGVSALDIARYSEEVELSAQLEADQAEAERLVAMVEREEAERLAAEAAAEAARKLEEAQALEKARREEYERLSAELERVRAEKNEAEAKYEALKQQAARQEAEHLAYREKQSAILDESIKNQLEEATTPIKKQLEDLTVEFRQQMEEMLTSFKSQTDTAEAGTEGVISCNSEPVQAAAVDAEEDVSHNMPIHSENVQDEEVLQSIAETIATEPVDETIPESVDINEIEADEEGNADSPKEEFEIDNIAEALLNMALSEENAIAKEVEPKVQTPEKKASPYDSMSRRTIVGSTDRIDNGSGDYAESGEMQVGIPLEDQFNLEAQSRIGTEAGLTDEQRDLFSYFVPVRGMSEQLVDVLRKDRNADRDGSSRFGNIVVAGDSGNGKTVLAIDMIKAIQKQRSMKSGRIAIIKAEALNRKDIPSTLNKIYGGALVIENAGMLSQNTVYEIDDFMSGNTDNTLFVLEDSKPEIEELFAENPDFAAKFSSMVEVPVFVNDELVTFGQSYAREHGFRIDEIAILALYSRIDLLQREDHRVTVAEVKEIMDEAFDRARSSSMRRTMTSLFKKNDGSEMVSLKEEDFAI